MKKSRVIFFIFFLLYTSVIFSQKNNPNDAISQEILNLISKTKTDSNFKKAGLFFINKEYDSVLVYSMKYLFQKNKKPKQTSFCHFFRGVSFQQKKILEEAEKELKLVTNSFRFFETVLFRLGSIALEKRKFKDAIDYFERIGEFETEEFNKGLKYTNIGVCYLHLKEYAKAEVYLLKSLELFEQKKDTLRIIPTYINIANLNYEQYKDDEAIVYFLKAYQLSNLIDDFSIKQNVAFNMAIVEENRNNLLAALAFRKEGEVWKDSLNNQNKIWSLVQTEKKYALKEKQKEIQLLESENKLKRTERNGLIVISGLLLILFGLSIYFYQLKIKQNRIIIKQKEKLNDLNTTKDRLFSIISHDLRSSVNALKNNKNKLLESLQSKNYNQLDTLLHSNSLIINSTYGLLDNLLNWALLQSKQDFFYIESHRLSSILDQVIFNYSPILLDKKIELKLDVSNDIFIYVDLDSMKIIFRNLLDNSIKFSSEGSFITIYIKKTKDNYCKIVFEDFGKGMTADFQRELLNDSFSISKNKKINKEGTGLGFQLCKSLIEKNGGKIQIESDLNIGTKIIISCPLSN